MKNSASSIHPALPLGAALLVALTALLLFLPSIEFDFVYFDDDQYVFQNPLVTSGLAWDSIRAAWSGFYASYWVPLLWMSYQIDHALFGLDPAGFHFVNILWHAINAGLLCWLLHRWTGSLLGAIVGAGLFAVHPLRVESVAWITERKDVLSLCFGLLAIIAYDRAIGGGRRTGRFLVAGFMAAGLLVKPVLVVLPALLLLLDVWPYRRTTVPLWSRVAEKWPLWLLAMAAGVVTLFAQQQSLVGADESPLWPRILNIPAVYGFYLSKTIWPTHLSVLYPDVRAPMWITIGYTASILSISWLLWRDCARYPAFFTGWFWVLLALAPFSGLLKTGTVQVADRFMYLPAIGVSVIVAAALAGASAGRSWARSAALLCSAVALAVLAGLTWRDLPRWRDSASLFKSAIDTYPHYAAHYNYAHVLLREGRPAEAATHFAESVRQKPDRTEARYNLGTTLAQLGQVKDARSVLEDVCRMDLKHIGAWRNLGNLYYVSGDEAKAMMAFQNVYRLNPNDPEVINNIAWLKAAAVDRNLRKSEDAVRLARMALAMRPDRPDFIDTYAAALAANGDFPDAIAAAEDSIRRYRAAGQTAEAKKVEARLATYRAGKAL